MLNENEIRDNILNTSKKLFFNYGFRKITMNDVAKELGISKKTIYKFFSSKKEILSELIRRKALSIENLLNNKLAEIEYSEDFVSNLSLIIKSIGNEISELKPPFFYDLEKYAPNVYNRIRKLQVKMVGEKFHKVLEKGIEKGFIRDDLDPSLVSEIYLKLIQSLLGTELLYNASLSKIFDTVVKMVFEGLLTEKGKKIDKN